MGHPQAISKYFFLPFFLQNLKDLIIVVVLFLFPVKQEHRHALISTHCRIPWQLCSSCWQMNLGISSCTIMCAHSDNRTAYSSSLSLFSETTYSWSSSSLSWFIISPKRPSNTSTRWKRRKVKKQNVTGLDRILISFVLSVFGRKKNEENARESWFLRRLIWSFRGYWIEFLHSTIIKPVYDLEIQLHYDQITDNVQKSLEK